VLAALPSVFVIEGTRLGGGFRKMGAAVAIVLSLGWLAQRALGLSPPRWMAINEAL
jgi:hypothetical protein